MSPKAKNSTNIAQLANTHNDIYELCLENDNPEARKPLGEKKLAEWVAER